MWCKSLKVLNPYEALKEANMTDLKPCPFCGGEAFLYYSGSESVGFLSEVVCKKCWCRTARLRDETAIEAWNRRAGEKDGNGAGRNTALSADAGY